MSIDQLINILVTITLIEMMVAIGLDVTFGDLVAVVRDWSLVARAALANYICVPAVTIGLLFLFQAQPVVAAGFIILAACPGAPYGPPFTSIAKGNVSQAIGLMVLLAGSSAVIAPVLIGYLLPFVSIAEGLQVDAIKIVATLLLTQLLPLCVGISLHQFAPKFAGRLQTPAKRLSKVMNLAAVGLIIVVQFDMLIQIRPLSFLGMLMLLVATWVFGWLIGGRKTENRKTMTITTSLRNISVALVVATGTFPGTSAVTAVAAYGLISLLGSLFLAILMGRHAAPHLPSTAAPLAAR